MIKNFLQFLGKKIRTLKIPVLIIIPNWILNNCALTEEHASLRLKHNNIKLKLKAFEKKEKRLIKENEQLLKFEIKKLELEEKNLNKIIKNLEKITEAQQLYLNLLYTYWDERGITYE